MKTALVIGAGPAGLMAADVLSAAGVHVTIADQMPSFGRKFLMAGKSGLNLTKDEPAVTFAGHYPDIPEAMHDALAQFGPADVIAWAQGLGQDVFAGSTMRVFPKAMKASPLLRAWLARLAAAGCQFERRWKWVGWDADAAKFETPDGEVALSPDITILAMGGASWKRLGSDGGWAQHAPTVPFAPANAGLMMNWSPHMERHFGQPLKGIAMRAGQFQSRGEIVISKRGIEGGGIYALSKPLREGAALHVDLLPDWDVDRVRQALQRGGKKASIANKLRKTLRLDPAQIALLQECGRPLPDDIAPLIKALPVAHAGLRPIDEAISTAGGVPFDALDGFMLKDRPRVFVAGEMLDWEAPTGGYLITGCLASGKAAANDALKSVDVAI